MRCPDCAGSGVVAAHGLGQVACVECDGTGRKTPMTPELMDIAVRLADLKAQGAAVLVSSVGNDPQLIKGRLMGYVCAVEDGRVGKREAEIKELCERVIEMIREGRAA